MKRTTRYAANVAALVAFAFAFIPSAAIAYKLKPHGTTAENRVRFLERNRFGSWIDASAARLVDHFSYPVHEELTHRIYGCGEPLDRPCVVPLPWGTYAPQAVLFGVQWNDNPPFQLISTSVSGCPKQTTIRLPNFSDCWFALFKDAEKRAATDTFDGASGVALIYRVHFGDLQFLHAMGSWNGERARDTKASVMAWAELTYRVSTGEISPATRLVDVKIDGVREAFLHNGWSIEALFTLGQDAKMKQGVGDVAFGSLLHMIQDSFARGHVDRDEATASSVCPQFERYKKAGDIREFHSYSSQDKDKHAEKDARNFMESHLTAASPTAVEIGKTLVDMRAKQVPWSTVGGYLNNCVFALPDEYKQRPAGPGSDFRS